jgi:hypothetical protein
MSRSYDCCEEIYRKASPLLIGIEPSLLCVLGGFWRSDVPCITVEKCHPRIQTPGCQNLGPLSASCYEGPGVELPGPLDSYPFTVHAQNVTRLSGHFYYLLYIVVRGDHDFSLHLLSIGFDALAPLLLQPVSFDFSTDSSDGGRAFFGA